MAIRSEKMVQSDFEKNRIPRWYFSDKQRSVQFKATLVIDDIEYNESIFTEYEYFKLFLPCFCEGSNHFFFRKEINESEYKIINAELENIKKILFYSKDISRFEPLYQKGEYSDEYLKFVLINKEPFIVMIYQLQQWLEIYLASESKGYVMSYKKELISLALILDNNF